MAAGELWDPGSLDARDALSRQLVATPLEQMEFGDVRVTFCRPSKPLDEVPVLLVRHDCATAAVW
jgi:hypothetical protein